MKTDEKRSPEAARAGEKGRRWTAAALAFVLAAALALWCWRPWGGGLLVVYCAHDSVYAEGLLRHFERQTGIRVAVRYDAEATKSLGLVELLLREKDAPRCDVFWNNELLGTLELAKQDVLLPYAGPGYAATPDGLKAPDARWTGLAARLRVWIVNTNRMAATEEAVREHLTGDLSRVAIAKPLYGTTRTQYAALWQEWGAEKLKAWHREWRRRGVREVGGNAMVKNLVAEGACDLGLTDSDDALVAQREGKPVAMLPVRLDDGRTICIPNTVGIVLGTRRLEQAKRLVEFLLSPDSQIALAWSGSGQIPLCAVPDDPLPDDVAALQRWAADAYPLARLGEAGTACLAWLKAQYLSPAEDGR